MLHTTEPRLTAGFCGSEATATSIARARERDAGVAAVGRQATVVVVEAAVVGAGVAPAAGEATAVVAGLAEAAGVLVAAGDANGVGVAAGVAVARRRPAR